MPIDTLPASSLNVSAIVIGVTANAASTVNANTINFNNTTTVTVNVQQGPSGVANVSFSSEGRVSLGLLMALGA